LLTNDLCLGFERGLGNKNSIEVKFAVIGIGNEDVEDYYGVEGYFIKAGYKMIRTKNGVKNSIYGSYVKPEIGFSHFTVNNTTYNSKSLILNIGTQTVMFGPVVLDLYGGIGVAFNDRPDYYNPYWFFYNNERTYFYSHVSLGTDKFTSAFSGGLVLSVQF
jgi:hypothetical protein